MVQFCAQIDACNCLVNDFIDFFQNLFDVFGNDFIKIKIIPMFDQLINYHDTSSTGTK